MDYQPKFEKGDEIMVEQEYKTILDRKDGEYYLSWKARLRWKDASDIDAVATKRKTQ